MLRKSSKNHQTYGKHRWQNATRNSDGKTEEKITNITQNDNPEWTKNHPQNGIKKLHRKREGKRGPLKSAACQSRVKTICFPHRTRPLVIFFSRMKRFAPKKRFTSSADPLGQRVELSSEFPNHRISFQISESYPPNPPILGLSYRQITE